MSVKLTMVIDVFNIMSGRITSNETFDINLYNNIRLTLQVNLIAYLKFRFALQRYT